MYPINWTNISSWEDYQNYGDGGYKKFVYLCRNGSNWYDGSILRSDGITIDRYCSASTYIELGNVTSAAMTLYITAPPNDIVYWSIGDEIEVQVDPDDRATISTPSADVAKMGIFVVDSISERDGNYTVSCLDRMLYMDVEMDWTGFSTNYPIQTVLSNIASQCGITLANSITGFPNATVGWYTNPTMTCRQVVSAIAEVIGACAFMDWNGELRFQWYEPCLDANNNMLYISDAVATDRWTDANTYAIETYSIGEATDSTVNDRLGVVEYKIIGNALVEGARDYITVSTLADNITNARFTTAPVEKWAFNGGDYTTLPFPYIWPLDVLQVGPWYVPVTHTVYKLNGNMMITCGVNPIQNSNTAFTSSQQTVINNMQAETDAINKHFFYANATGAHITTVENDPDSGNNVLIDSSGMYIREDTDTLAEFTATGAIVGPTSAAHAEVSTNGLQVYESDGLSVIANLGYGPGNDSGGSTVDAPYYTIGVRDSYGGIGNYSVAEGFDNEASGFSAHAEGRSGHATGIASHSEGSYCSATDMASHAEGLQSEATAAAAHAQNAGTIAASWAQTAIGQYNVADSADTYALIIGNGADNNTRANALTVDWYGNVNCSGIKTDSKINLVSSQNPSYTGGYIQAVNGDANGSVVLIRPGASLIAGGGEYASNRWAVGDITTSNEKTFIGADSVVYIESNGNTIGNRKTWEFDTSGNITAPNGATIEVPYKNESATVTTIYGYGYTGATGNPNKYNYYFEVPLPRKIASGSTITVTALTGAIRGVSGLVAANATNLLGNVASASNASNGLLHLNIQNISANWAQNTPASIIINSISFTVS